MAENIVIGGTYPDLFMRNVSGTVELFYRNPAGVETQITSGGSMLVPWREDEFTAGAGQTAFTLSFAPPDTNSVTLSVNGVLYDDVADWTVVGTAVTWLDTPFALEVGDKVLIRYISA
uniref:Uncharacterized protein n=1 Tax=viral metagenome TaxID=1070528 RepID=A0A6M3X7P7_9ZZZZ